MKAIALILFVIDSAIHLYASLQKNRMLRARTKVFLLPLLLWWYVLASEPPMMLFILALAFSWLGDVLLIPEGTKWFVAGGIAFMVSHLFFVLSYSRNVNFSTMPVWVILPAALIYIAAVMLVFRGLKPHLLKALFYPMFLYLLINGTMNCFALYQLVSLPCTATATVFVGAVLFFTSDSLLFYTRFKKDTKLKSHFAVMFTYLLGEFLITLGMILL